MLLTSGARLGSYEIVGALGAGGMGEVYRARDTKLGREVAIKILPRAFTSDPERLARFDREAQVLASLNHPNIGTLYGVEETESSIGGAGMRALVMELVEGETLAERIAGSTERIGGSGDAGSTGPGLHIAEALRIARQIADALDAAHEKGIVHRDLKPANIKITPTGAVKVLDFGLAKLTTEADGSPDLSQLPTATVAGTRDGVILGTAAYMSPEQARGKPVDKRTDIWAFGCVLFEMLTGRAAFRRETTSDTIAAILEREPDWTPLRETTPVAVRRLLERCLEKDSRRRLRDIADARLDLEASEPPKDSVLRSPLRPLNRTHVAGFLLACLAAGLLGWLAGARVWRSTDVASTLAIRSTLPLPDNTRLASTAVTAVAIAPDGGRVVYAASSDGPRRLFVRELDQPDATAIAGTEGATGPFFSPDGQWIGFYAGGRLRKVAIRGGSAVPLTDFDTFGQYFGATWGADDTIFFAGSFAGGISRVPASGGQPEAVTSPDVEKGERSHSFPEVLPGGKGLIFTIKTADMRSFDDAIIAARSLETGEQKTVIQGGTHARFVAIDRDSGYVVYARSGGLFALPFDVRTLEATGPSARILDELTTNVLNGVAEFSVSDRGTLTYATGAAIASSRLVWVDRSGTVDEFPLTEFRPLFQRLSPDGSRLATERDDANHDVWIYDVPRATISRLTFNGDSHYPIWTPNGRRVVFRSGSPQNLFWVPVDSSQPPELLVTSEHDKLPSSWSPDGRWLAFSQLDPATSQDIWVLSLADRKARPFLVTPYEELDAVFSPDGRWLAYVSNATGRTEVYVQPFPGPGERWQVSSEGGAEPVWGSSGTELFYRSGRRMMVVDVSMQPTFRAGRPRVLFEGSFTATRLHASYDVARGSQRFVMIQNDPAPPIRGIQLVVKWVDELKRRMAGGAMNR